MDPKSSKKKYRRDTEELEYIDPDSPEENKEEPHPEQKESEPFTIDRIDQIKSRLTVESDLDDDSDYYEERQKMINAEILEIAREDEDLKKTQNKDFNKEKINIEKDWKAKEYFDIELKRLIRRVQRMVF